MYLRTGLNKSLFQDKQLNKQPFAWKHRMTKHSTVFITFPSLPSTLKTSCRFCWQALKDWPRLFVRSTVYQSKVCEMVGGKIHQYLSVISCEKKTPCEVEKGNHLLHVVPRLQYIQHPKTSKAYQLFKTKVYPLLLLVQIRYNHLKALWKTSTAPFVCISYCKFLSSFIPFSFVIIASEPFKGKNNNIWIK